MMFHDMISKRSNRRRAGYRHRGAETGALLVVVIVCLLRGPLLAGAVRSGSISLWGQSGGPLQDYELGLEYSAVAVGGYHSLALTIDGRVVAWGENGSGQCNAPRGGGFTAIAAGYYHSLALKFDGSILAWGDNRREQCQLPYGKDFVVVAAGDWHSLAIRSDGSLFAWGWDDRGQCQVPSGNNYKAVCGGFYHSLALTRDRSLVAWGGNGDGQCDVPKGDDFVAIAAGSFHSLALRADGSIVAWGRNDYGQCNAPAGAGFVAIAAGAFHSLALHADGSAVGWGFNSNGQCAPPADARFVSIGAGRFHSVGIEADPIEADVAVPTETIPTPETLPADSNAVEELQDANTVDTEVVPTLMSPDANDLAEETLVEGTAAIDVNGVSAAVAQTVAPSDINEVGPSDVNVADAVAVDANVPPDANGVKRVVTTTPPPDANTVEPANANGVKVVVAVVPDANAVASVDPNVAAVVDPNALAVTQVVVPSSGVQADANKPAGQAASVPVVFKKMPVYHFTSESSTPHFYTISKTERDRLIDNYPDRWTYQGVAFQAYPPGPQPPGTTPVYRFWSSLLSTHFYTQDEAEKDRFIKEYSGLWKFEGVVWYSDQPYLSL